MYTYLWGNIKGILMLFTIFQILVEELMLLNCGVAEDSWESLGPARRSNQSILKEISPGWSLKGLMLKLKLQYFGHLMQRTDSLEKTLMLGRLKAGGERDSWGWDGWMAPPTQWTWVWVSSGSWWWKGKPGMLQSMGLQRVGHDCDNWTEILVSIFFFFSPELSLCHPNFFSLSLVVLYVSNIIIGLNTGISIGLHHDSRYCPTTWLLHWNWSWLLCIVAVSRLDIL